MGLSHTLWMNLSKMALEVSVVYEKEREGERVHYEVIFMCGMTGLFQHIECYNK